MEIDVEINYGDTTEELSEKIDKALSQKMPEDSYRVEQTAVESKQKGRQKGSVGGKASGPDTGTAGDTGTLYVDEFDIVVANATHVDAGSNAQGKVTFSGINIDGSGGGVTVHPPRGPRMKSQLKRLEYENLKRGYAFVPLWYRDRFNFAPPLPPILPPKPPLPPVTAPPTAEFGRGRIAQGGGGLLLLSEFAERMSVLRFSDLLVVPFDYITTSPAAQVEEFALRLAQAGVTVSVREGIVVPEEMPWGRGPVRTFGFVELWSIDSRFGGFPWQWVMLPKAQENTRLSEGLREAAVDPVGDMRQAAPVGLRGGPSVGQSAESGVEVRGDRAPSRRQNGGLPR